MPRQNQAAITVPASEWERVKALPLEDLGYLSPTEFVRDAIREKCDREKTAGPNPRPRRGRKKSVVPILLILGALVLASLASPGARAASSCST